MKNWMMILLSAQLGAAIVAHANVGFDKAICQKALPAGYSVLCDVHEQQLASDSFRKDAVYGYSYSSCNKFSGEISSASPAVPCVVYFVESNLKKDIALHSIFGITPKYPLNYKGLFINFIVRPQPRQMGYNSGLLQRQIGDTSTSRQYGEGQSSPQFGDGGRTGGSGQMQ